MNYKENKIDWKVGDLVLHDADAKKEQMLMKVIEIMTDGQIKTRLVDPYMGRCPDHHRPLTVKERTFVNDKKYLHDPQRFNVKCV